MTIQEIIASLRDQAEDKKGFVIEDDPEDIIAQDIQALTEAADLPGENLSRQAPAKLVRERWPGCAFCSRIKASGAEAAGFPYCPACGKPLTEDAWVEMEGKIGGRDET